MPGGSAGSVMVRTVEDLRTVDHACAIPVSDEQLWERTSTFVAAGLAAGEQVLYFDGGTCACVLERLADDFAPIAESMPDGSLIVAPPDTTRATLRSPPPYVQDLICGTVDDAVERGYSGVRLTG